MYIGWGECQPQKIKSLNINNNKHQILTDYLPARDSILLKIVPMHMHNGKTMQNHEIFIYKRPFAEENAIQKTQTFFTNYFFKEKNLRWPFLI